MIVRLYSMSSGKTSEDIETGVSGRSRATTFLAVFSCTRLAKELIKLFVLASGFASRIGRSLSAKKDSSISSGSFNGEFQGSQRLRLWPYDLARQPTRHLRSSSLRDVSVTFCHRQRDLGTFLLQNCIRSYCCSVVKYVRHDVRAIGNIP